MKYIIYTLGCKVNQYETQAMETLLNNHGHFAAAEGERADAVIINTCAVTAEAGRKSRQTINRLHEENPDAVIAVSGCYSQLSPESALKLGAKIVFGTGDRHSFVDAIETAVLEGKEARSIDKPFERRVFEELPAGAVSGHTRALLKVQDGCVNFCSYCIIPYTRGRLRSLSLETAAKMAEKLDDEGYKELVITGIEISSYGVDLEGKPDMADVVNVIADAAPNMRLRLGSLEPSIIDDALCSKLARSGRVCRHFHLSLQSGCDKTLRAMNRKYDTARFFETAERLRKYFPGCALTADLIVGFPGETEENHAETLSFIESVGFADIHVFPYSRRPGTPADKMEAQLDRKTKEKRAREAAAVAKSSHRAFLESCIGKTLSVLFETEDKGLWQGHSDTYVLVRAEGEKLKSELRDVLIYGIEGEALLGKII